MAEETNVGNIYLDLIVRDTVEKQVQNVAAKGQAAAQKAFSGMEKATESMVNKVTASAAQATQKASANVAQSVNKSVALAQAKVNELERAFDSVTAKLDKQWNSGTFDPSKKATSSLLAQQEKLFARIESARERLAIQVKIAADKQAAAESAASQKAAAAEEKAANRRKAVHASMWKNMLSHAGGSIKKMLSKLLSLNKGFNTSGSTARRFESRLREIATGALIFNGISSAMRNMVGYFSKTIASTDEMKQALANLKGAAANAASPIIQVLTPALAALANTAATVLTYVERLLTRLTGKVSNAAATAAKSSEKAASAAKKAAKSLAGFDQIERLGGDSDSSGSDSTNDSVEPNYDFQGQSRFLDSTLSAINAGQWEKVGALIGQKLSESLEKIHNFFRNIKWEEIGNNIASGLYGLLDSVNWGLLGQVLTDGLRGIFEALHGFVTEFSSSGGFVKVGTKIAEMLKGAFGNIDWAQLAADLSACVAGLFTSVIAFIREIDWNEVGSTIVECLMSIKWADMFLGVFSFVGACVEGLFDLASGVFEKLAEHCGDGFFGGLFKAFSNIFSWIKNNLVTPLVDAVCKLLGIHSPSTVFAEIGKNLILGLLSGIAKIWIDMVDFFEDAFTNLQNAFSETWDKISSTVSDVTEGIKGKVITAFTSVKDSIATIFYSVKNTITSIWNGISSAIKGAINGIIGFINGMISAITSGINTVIRALNKLSFTIPDWLKNVPGAKNIAGKKFGFDIRTITAPQIPYLANGGVITQPTLAMMGEYAGAGNNPEIVAPQSVMAETVAGVMEDVIASNIAGFEAVVAVLREILEAVLGIEIGDDVIGRAVERYNRKMAVVKGGT